MPARMRSCSRSRSSSASSFCDMHAPVAAVSCRAHEPICWTLTEVRLLTSVIVQSHKGTFRQAWHAHEGKAVRVLPQPGTISRAGVSCGMKPSRTGSWSGCVDSRLPTADKFCCFAHHLAQVSQHFRKSIQESGAFRSVQQPFTRFFSFALRTSSSACCRASSGVSCFFGSVYRVQQGMQMTISRIQPQPQCSWVSKLHACVTSIMEICACNWCRHPNSAALACNCTHFWD